MIGKTVTFLVIIFNKPMEQIFIVIVAFLFAVIFDSMSRAKDKDNNKPATT